MIEFWKEIKGFDDNYEISSFGRVRRYRVLKGNINGGGHVNVCLYHQGKRTVFALHVLVGIYFLNYDPDKQKLKHIYNNKLNNRADNLSVKIK